MACICDLRAAPQHWDAFPSTCAFLTVVALAHSAFGPYWSGAAYLCKWACLACPQSPPSYNSRPPCWGRHYDRLTVSGRAATRSPGSDTNWRITRLFYRSATDLSRVNWKTPANELWRIWIMKVYYGWFVFQVFVVIMGFGLCNSACAPRPHTVYEHLCSLPAANMTLPNTGRLSATLCQLIVFNDVNGTRNKEVDNTYIFRRPA